MPVEHDPKQGCPGSPDPEHEEGRSQGREA
jgi:hypothetical protein